MASNYNLDYMVNYLDKYNQQQGTPQYQVSPEQVQAYANLLNLRGQQEQDRQYELAQLAKAKQYDNRVNTIGNVFNAMSNAANNRNASPIDLVFRDYKGNVMGQMSGTNPTPQSIYQPSNQRELAVANNINLQEQARQQQLANAQEMAKFQDALALSNQYGIPIGQAMELSGKDILGYEKDKTTAQAGVQKELVGSIGDLFKENLATQGDLQVQELKNSGDYNVAQLKAINDFLIADTKTKNDYAIAQLKEKGLNDRQIQDILARKEIANINAKAQTGAATIRANATKYAADQRAQAQPSYGPLSAGLNNFMFLPPEQQAMVMNDYATYAKNIGLRNNPAPQITPQNINTMNNYINNQDASSRW